MAYKAFVTAQETGGIPQTFAYYDVNYVDTTANQIVDANGVQLFFGSDIALYTLAEIQAAIQTKILAESVSQGYGMTAADIIWSIPSTKSSTYQALINQSGTSAPTANQYINDFTGVTFTWARTGTGVYTLTANSAVFTANKTAVIMSNPPAFLSNYKYVVTSSTVITFQTATTSVLSLILTAGNADALLTNTMVYVVVYI